MVLKSDVFPDASGPMAMALWVFPSRMPTGASGQGILSVIAAQRSFARLRSDCGELAKQYAKLVVTRERMAIIRVSFRSTEFAFFGSGARGRGGAGPGAPLRGSTGEPEKGARRCG